MTQTLLHLTIFLGAVLSVWTQSGNTNETRAPPSYTISSGPIRTCGIAKVPPVTPNCALNSQAIVGGVESAPLSWPWMVSMRLKGESWCGGTLIDSDTVLTAAHCTYGHKVGDLEVTYGSVNVNDNTFKNQVREIRQHEKFDLKAIDNDIAILKLKIKVKFNDAIRPICLPTADDKPKDNAACYVIGWGDQKENATTTTKFLREVCINVMSLQKCNFDGNPDGKMCAGVPAGDKDHCYGDSGGPLSCKINGVWKLRGIVSAGEGCGSRKYHGIYADVSYYANWIQEHRR